MDLLVGTKDHRLDGQDRLVIPSIHAKAICEECDGTLILVPTLHLPCIDAFPPGIYREYAEQERPNPFHGVQRDRRSFFHGARKVDIKGPGRITLPKEFAARFPSKVVRVAGMYTYLELWDPAAYDAYHEQAQSAGPEASTAPPASEGGGEPA